MYIHSTVVRAMCCANYTSYIQPVDVVKIVTVQRAKMHLIKINLDCFNIEYYPTYNKKRSLSHVVRGAYNIYTRRPILRSPNKILSLLQKKSIIANND